MSQCKLYACWKADFYFEPCQCFISSAYLTIVIDFGFVVGFFFRRSIHHLRFFSIRHRWMMVFQTKHTGMSTIQITNKLKFSLFLSHEICAQNRLFYILCRRTRTKRGFDFSKRKLTLCGIIFFFRNYYLNLLWLIRNFEAMELSHHFAFGNDELTIIKFFFGCFKWTRLFWLLDFTGYSHFPEDWIRRSQFYSIFGSNYTECSIKADIISTYHCLVNTNYHTKNNNFGNKPWNIFNGKRK